MKQLWEILPDQDLFLALEPEELAGVVLEVLNSIGSAESGKLNRHYFGMSHVVSGYPRERHAEMNKAVMEAWVWLEREGLVAPAPGDSGAQFVFITRRGQQMRTAADLQAYRRAGLLPRQLMHPVIAGTVVAPFIRGDYETAVFQAFKAVEVAVRKKGGYAATDVGTTLMRLAFDKNNGPLRDPAIPDPEREATAHLFAGAIGRYKNPGSHREAVINDPGEAVELLLLASHLLRIVDAAP